jgi:hypothetical protein
MVIHYSSLSQDNDDRDIQLMEEEKIERLCLLA